MIRNPRGGITFREQVIVEVLGHVHFKRMQDMSKDRDAIFDKNRFSSVPRPSQWSLVNGTEDIGGSVVPKEVIEKVVQQIELELRKSKRNRTPKDFGHTFQLYLIKGTRDELSDQYSYFFNIEDDPKTFDEVMKFQDVAFWKEAINDAMESIMGNKTWVSSDLPPGCKPLGCKWIFKRKLKIDVKKAFLNGDLEEDVYMNNLMASSCLAMKARKFDESGKGVIICLYVDDMLIFVSTLMDTNEKLMPNNSQAVSQLKYSRVIGCLIYAMTCTRLDIAFDVGKLSTYTSNPSTQHWQAIQWVLKYLKKTIYYRLTYTGYPLVLEAAGKEAEWLKNLLLKISLWSKPIAPISIHCDSAATLAKAYSQMYNRKSRHLGVRHSMIRELITN
nr:zinc finger, CCHC-type [Tanacetum cinerariifolium]